MDEWKVIITKHSGKFHLLDPLSRLPLRHSCASVDLLEFTISKIREAYEVHDWRTRREKRPRFKRVVLVKDKEGDNQVLGILCTGKMKFGPPVGDNITNGCSGERSLVECCGQFYIVDQLFGKNPRKRKADTVYANAKTVSFKVYKFDEEQGKVVEVKSLQTRHLRWLPILVSRFWLMSFMVVFKTLFTSPRIKKLRCSS
ncbi:unnamed protein product [Arabidopsis halleri]